MKQVVIIGGGITGLSAAFYLDRAIRDRHPRIRYTLLDQSSRWGGKIITERHDGFIVEGGPDSFITQKPWGLQLCRDLGLGDELLPCNEHLLKVYLQQRGGLIPLPDGFRFAAPTRLLPFAASPLFSPSGKLRMMMDWWIPPRRDETDESVASFVRRRFGEEAVNKIAGPLMAGIYVADPERLSLQSSFPMFAAMEKKYGSLIRGMRKAAATQPASSTAVFMSLKGGMADLVRALQARLTGDIRLGSSVRDIERSGHQYRVLTEDGPPVTADHVILAVPAHVASSLLNRIAPDVSRALAQIRYVSTATLSLAYPASAIPEPYRRKGFGFVIPQSEDSPLLACTWSSNKFNLRAPENHMLIRAFIGGSRNEGMTDTPDDKLNRRVQNELTRVMGISGQPLFSNISRWPKGNPQYDVGHKERVAAMEQALSATSGLHLAGSPYHGIGIPDCIHSAMKVVERITA